VPVVPLPFAAAAAAAATDSRSAPVAALVQAAGAALPSSAAAAEQDEEEEESTSLVFYYEDENENEEDAAGASSSTCSNLRLDYSGLLSPSTLLELLPPQKGHHADEQEQDEHDDMILHLLNEKPDGAMLRASRRLYVAAIQATKDVQQFRQLVVDDDDDDDDDTEEHSRLIGVLPERVDLALRLILVGDDKKGCAARDDSASTTCCSHLSATQLLLAELDATLESIAPPRRQGGDSSVLSKWRIRDLLQSLRHKLGLPLSLVLHILVGPLNGVCLRNLVWHGYLGPSQVRQQWTCLLWLIVALGLRPYHHRSPKAISAISAVQRPPDDDEQFGKSIIPDEKAVDILLSASPAFLPPSMRPAFREALCLCRRTPGGATTKDAPLWRALALLYGVLERGLRVLYARENPFLPQNPLIARTDTLHVTLSTMLRSTVISESEDDEEGSIDGFCKEVLPKPNGLLRYLGEGAVNALFDEFVWIGLPDASDDAEEEPLPCRNELVHGTVALQDVSPKIVARIVRLTVGLAVLTVQEDDGVDNAAQVDPCTRQSYEWLLAYQPKRHPSCQVWQQFRSILRGDCQSQTGIVDALLPVTVPPLAKFSTSSMSKSITKLTSVSVEYCPVCSLPPEYCCYTESAVECLEHRFGPSDSATLPAVLLMAQRVYGRLLSQSTAGGLVEADELALAAELDAVPCSFIAASSTKAKHFGVGGGDVWSLLDAAPARRSSPEAELNKLWVIRETVTRCSQVSQQVHRRLLHLVALAARGETRMRVGSKKEPLVIAVHRLVVTLQVAELLLLISMHLYLAEEITSAELPMFLSISANTLLTHVQNGRLRLCMALGAGLVGGAKRGSACERLVGWLPKADREKYVLNLDKCLEYLVDGRNCNVQDLITNKFALGNSVCAHTLYSSEEREEGRSGAAWASLRRWQLMSTTI